MSEQTHTPTPWVHYHYPLSKKEGAIDAIMHKGTPSPKNEIVFWSGFEASHFPKAATANARRIVACVNACAGISNKALDGGVLTEMVKVLEWYADAILPYALTQNKEPRSAVHADGGKRARVLLAKFGIERQK